MISKKELFAEISNEAVTEDGEVVGYFIKNSRMNLLEQMLCNTVTVKLPEVYGYLRENEGQIQISIGAERPSDRSGGYATPWFAIYTAAGIKVEVE